MTVGTTDNRIAYTGTGTANPLPFPYKFLADADLVVTETVIATGVQTTKALTTDYTVTGAGADAGGSVTPVAVIPATVTWTIYNDPALSQGVDLVENDPLPAEEVESMADRLTLICQRIRSIIDRSLRQPDGDTTDLSALPAKVVRASKFLAFDGDGNPIASAGPTGDSGTPVSAFIGDNLFDDADAATARATLGAAALDAANTFTGVNTNQAQVRWAKGADVASAGALALGTDGNYFDITGTTTITSIGTLGIGTRVRLHFDGALTLTHHATDLILPGGVNITTAAGDEAEFVEYATGDWRCVSYQVAADLVRPAGTPCFSVHRNGTDQTSITISTFVKVQFTTEAFDVGGYFDNATNYRFTPLVAGKYLLTGAAMLLALADQAKLTVAIYKNGAIHKSLGDVQQSDAGGGSVQVAGSAVVEANGSTDYFELFVFHNSSGTINLEGDAQSTYLQGFRIGA